MVTTGPILECGTGLSTIMLGLVAQQRSIKVWSLDHEEGWVRTVDRSLSRFGIDSVQVLHAPLSPFKDYEWYYTSADRFPRDFALVICDGPPGSTPGGRYGLLPRLHRHLCPGCVILLDDAAREGERSVLERWSSEFGVDVRFQGSLQPFAEVLLPR
jgi:predicted O-methyltransferase YrrM